METGGAPQPILVPTTPISASEGVRAALGTADEGNVLDLARQVAQANITVTIAADRDHPEQVAYQLVVPLPDDFGQEGQQREPISSNPNAGRIEIADKFWTQSEGGAPSRLVTVQLSEPFTFRAQTLQTIVEVMTVAAIIALIVAVIASVFIANRLANPIRRLTSAARELSEGHLDVRVVPPSSSPEVSDLSEAFNAMAERLQQSIDFIRRDRDRSRDFLADVSHELRTPIAALRTFNELLADEEAMDDATRHEFLEQSRQQIERLDWLATNLLELSKLESGLVLLDLRPDDLRAVLENARPATDAQRRSQGRQARYECPRRTDPSATRSAAAGPGPHQPDRQRDQVHAGRRQRRGDSRANGRGGGAARGRHRCRHRPQELPNVFDRFYRGAQAHESRAAGSGLGLVDRPLDRRDAQRTGGDHQHARAREHRYRWLCHATYLFLHRPLSALKRGSWHGIRARGSFRMTAMQERLIFV